MTEKMHILTPGTDAQRVVDCDLPAEPSLAQLRAVVEPHLNSRLERVAVVLPSGELAHMFVGEKSADGSWPRNEAATEHYRRSWLTTRPATEKESLPAVYGPAVLFLRRVWF